ncbi:hypothetical protein TSUD_223860 [Trifolium subterraneum]|uniref:Reverse transcriptase domain-containing protein n=1 Tax=Trifolium subterraneum TaxID=3900 RepID=A0A2Z6N1B1_TRISU|nr:hypothetical protein TSUD_223860 [Trifolium subterraneum]
MCGHEIYAAECSWLESRSFPPNLISKNITLIPKVVANRLKPILNKCISENQSPFVPGRSILDNVMAAMEIIHFMKSKTRDKKGETTLKLDISKAYDRIDWEFLKEMMNKMGFSQQWISWIMLCVVTVDYSIIVNGHKVGPIVPGRGLRQDDCFPFFKATVNEAAVVKNVLSVYETTSGQAINLQKSEFYCSRNVSAETREAIASHLGVTQVLGRIEKMLNSFWWDHSGNNGRGIHRLSWEHLSVSKDHDGMGFKSLKAFNIAMLGKQAWNLVTKPDCLITKLLKARYFPKCDFLEANIFGGVFGAQNPSSMVVAVCKWSIGTREKIDIWEQNWLKEGLSIATPSNMQRPGDLNKVKDIIMSNSKFWDIDKISSMFDSTTVRCIINTPLLASVLLDKLVWKLEHDGVYSVCSAYNYYVNNVGNQDNSGIAGNWHHIWRAKVPPKVKNYCGGSAVMCYPHVQVCTAAVTECWQQAGLWNQIHPGLNTSNNIADILLFILQSLNKEQQEIFSVLLWSIWKRMNAKVWNNITESNTNVYERAQHLLTSWKQAQQTRSYANTSQPVQQHTNWEKPSRGRYKCNIDASFSSTHNKVEIDMCIRDGQGRYVAAKTEWLEPIVDVEIGEAMGLFSAVKWVDELRLSDVDCEMDCKRVVDCLHSSRTYNSDLRDILRDCTVILATNLVNSHVKFIRRQANEVAHRLARAATSLASFHIFIDIPTCIYDIIMNEMR